MLLMGIRNQRYKFFCRYFDKHNILIAVYVAKHTLPLRVSCRGACACRLKSRWTWRPNSNPSDRERPRHIDVGWGTPVLCSVSPGPQMGGFGGPCPPNFGEAGCLPILLDWTRGDTPSRLLGFVVQDPYGHTRLEFSSAATATITANLSSP